VRSLSSGPLDVSALEGFRGGADRGLRCGTDRGAWRWVARSLDAPDEPALSLTPRARLRAWAASESTLEWFRDRKSLPTEPRSLTIPHRRGSYVPSTGRSSSTTDARREGSAWRRPWRRQASAISGFLRCRQSVDAMICHERGADQRYSATAAFFSTLASAGRPVRCLATATFFNNHARCDARCRNRGSRTPAPLFLQEKSPARCSLLCGDAASGARADASFGRTIFYQRTPCQARACGEPSPDTAFFRSRACTLCTPATPCECTHVEGWAQSSGDEARRSIGTRRTRLGRARQRRPG
jgi:hypothetical protein